MIIFQFSFSLSLIIPTHSTSYNSWGSLKNLHASKEGVSIGINSLNRGYFLFQVWVKWSHTKQELTGLIVNSPLLHIPHTMSHSLWGFLGSTLTLQQREPGLRVKSFKESHSHLLAAKSFFSTHQHFQKLCFVEMFMREKGVPCSNVIGKLVIFYSPGRGSARTKSV